MDKLKPCPFCGGEAKIRMGYFLPGGHQFADVYCFVECLSCHAKTKWFEAKDEGLVDKAVDAWNKREGEDAERD